ncbi:tRNA (cytidine(34)-2'-O)-methyltransferase [Rhodococcoides yunnanense]|uniref:tRNA (cytidine(34)-2'-O)-methyltransferase n=1 Tax=Rhodococcoides yunnanense TaxID=278209 RepID=UPI00157CA365|nr:tRNA (cytidine(34)-2'-O)-methyltransferase [Rhodococcus yunnanensis]
MFRLMFFEPRIPQNTGNAIRLVAGTGCELHLVGPLGFDMSEPKLKRAGLDYHDLASVTVHENLSAAWDALAPTRVFAYTAHSSTFHTAVDYEPGDVLLFGPEPTGLPDDVLGDSHVTDKLRIPMIPGRRSLNLANAAAVVMYEAWRQHGFAGSV